MIFWRLTEIIIPSKLNCVVPRCNFQRVWWNTSFENVFFLSISPLFWHNLLLDQIYLHSILILTKYCSGTRVAIDTSLGCHATTARIRPFSGQPRETTQQLLGPIWATIQPTKFKFHYVAPQFFIFWRTVQIAPKFPSMKYAHISLLAWSYGTFQIP